MKKIVLIFALFALFYTVFSSNIEVSAKGILDELGDPGGGSTYFYEEFTLYLNGLPYEFIIKGYAEEDYEFIHKQSSTVQVIIPIEFDSDNYQRIEHDDLCLGVLGYEVYIYQNISCNPQDNSNIVGDAIVNFFYNAYGSSGAGVFTELSMQGDPDPAGTIKAWGN